MYSKLFLPRFFALPRYSCKGLKDCSFSACKWVNAKWVGVQWTAEFSCRAFLPCLGTIARAWRAAHSLPANEWMLSSTVYSGVFLPRLFALPRYHCKGLKDRSFSACKRVNAKWVGVQWTAEFSCRAFLPCLGTSKGLEGLLVLCLRGWYFCTSCQMMMTH